MLRRRLTFWAPAGYMASLFSGCIRVIAVLAATSCQLTEAHRSQTAQASDNVACSESQTFHLSGFEPVPSDGRVPFPNERTYRISSPEEAFEAGARYSYIEAEVCVLETTYQLTELRVHTRDNSWKSFTIVSVTGLKQLLEEDDYSQFQAAGRSEDNTLFGLIGQSVDGVQFIFAGQIEAIEPPWIPALRSNTFGHLSLGPNDPGPCGSGFSQFSDLSFATDTVSFEIDICVGEGSSGTKPYMLLRLSISDLDARASQFDTKYEYHTQDGQHANLTYEFPQTRHHNQGESITVHTPAAVYSSSPYDLGETGTMTIRYHDGHSKSLELPCGHFLLGCFLRR